MPAPLADDPLVLAPAQWRARAEAHRARITPYTEPLRELHSAGVRHPVHDFLFSYYSLTPGALERWHPGAGVVLAADPAAPDPAVPHAPGPDAGRAPHAAASPAPAAPGAGEPGGRFYRRLEPAPGLPEGGWTVDLAAFAERRGTMVEFARRILAGTARRPARLACFGLHEWAMAYRSEVHGVRHSTVPLRLGAEGTNRVVEENRIACSHFDAFRFYAPEAAPLNELQPTRATQVDLEQPGCLHANMDLYKWAYKLLPAVGSDLVADCFELAWRIRTMDMRASPYELAAWGLEPIRIETPAGRAEYVRHQRAFAVEANALRARLLEALAPLEPPEPLAAPDGSYGPDRAPGASSRG
ncbi:3-methyladenine DNA glycosylase [Citricoccus sp. SGAir0253]|uniref:3-methyladenine DNA glycosylase n=1 Tax=Citricoccus sp. SGAir0253 TaxID=2567881 RepID=UPI001FED2F77|nr:3-methyladenine DNA glycosylase [Citricoccus sp. SGAir0253]